MKPIKAFLSPLAAIWLLLLLATNSRADLLFTLDSILKSGDPGSEVVFTGTLANTGNSVLYLNGIQFNFDNQGLPYLTGDANLFLTNVPASLAASGSAGDTYAGPIFGVNIDAATPPGTYTGTVALTGGADNNATDILAMQNFGVASPSASVPETSALLGLGLGLIIMRGAVLRLRLRSDRQTS